VEDWNLILTKGTVTRAGGLFVVTLDGAGAWERLDGRITAQTPIPAGVQSLRCDVQMRNTSFTNRTHVVRFKAYSYPRDSAGATEASVFVNQSVNVSPNHILRYFNATKLFTPVKTVASGEQIRFSISITTTGADGDVIHLLATWYCKDVFPPWR
jgi:hypothetical protein